MVISTKMASFLKIPSETHLQSKDQKRSNFKSRQARKWWTNCLNTLGSITRSIVIKTFNQESHHFYLLPRLKQLWTIFLLKKYWKRTKRIMIKTKKFGSKRSQTRKYRSILNDTQKDSSLVQEVILPQQWYETRAFLPFKVVKSQLLHF